MKLISIITVCYNNVSGLKGTVDSVLRQDSSFWEMIIVDGASTDGTSNYLQKLHGKGIHIISEPDKGIYDAMNKGLNLAKGEYVFFLNSGDTFYQADVLSKALAQLSLSKPDLLIGNVAMDNSGHETMESRELTKYNLFQPGINHQRIFFNKSLFSLVGNYDTNFKIVADRDFLFRAFKKKKLVIEYLDATVCKFSIGGLSTSESTKSKAIQEQLQLFHTYFSPFEKLSYHLFLNNQADWPKHMVWKIVLSFLQFPLIRSFRYIMGKKINSYS